MPGGTLPLALAQALTYGNPVTLATGEYGSITADAGRYSNKWNDPTLSNLATTLKSLSFQPFPPHRRRIVAIQLYTYSFCGGCGIGSTVPERFSYGNLINVQQPAQLKTNISNPNIIKLKKP